MSLKGAFHPPGDKSISHRIALMALLASGECSVTNFSPCADVGSSLDAVKLIGVGARVDENGLTVNGAAGNISKSARIDCGNSGTTTRLLMGILAGRQGDFVLDGDASLRKRPMERVAIPLRAMGAVIDCTEGRLPVTVSGGALQGIEYDLPVASAQLKSAVLLAGIQGAGVTSVREPSASRDHTERLLQSWGARISHVSGRLLVENSALSLPPSLYVPGDASSAAFFLCAAAIIPGSEVTAEQMLLNPTRTGFLEVLKRMGAQIEVQLQGTEPEPRGSVTVRFTPNLAACRVSPGEIPALVDEVPILALVATQSRGTTVLEGVGELRLKESDRLAAVASQLGLMGARITVDGDVLIVEGPSTLKAPELLQSYSDHRIAMTLRLAALMVGADPVIEGEESTAISYPGFHDTLWELTR
ncbi:MAG: 3-phosphoshikimate 1-carboxyvinyltransferase [Desulfomonile tiedjei]|nr:3-phosphoshikimate 1-carboxyvinyltransferase [Desulfomonile tiedjei]